MKVITTRLAIPDEFKQISSKHVSSHRKIIEWILQRYLDSDPDLSKLDEEFRGRREAWLQKIKERSWKQSRDYVHNRCVWWPEYYRKNKRKIIERNTENQRQRRLKLKQEKSSTNDHGE